MQSTYILYILLYYIIYLYYTLSVVRMYLYLNTCKGSYVLVMFVWVSFSFSKKFLLILVPYLKGIPGIGSESSPTLTRIKHVIKINECCSQMIILYLTVLHSVLYFYICCRTIILAPELLTFSAASQYESARVSTQSR